MRRPLRVLLVKCYQPLTPQNCQPPLGILYLISMLRERFGTEVEAHFWDMRLFCQRPEEFAPLVAGRYDLIGISALNFEADVSHRLARAVKAVSPGTVLALGGPYSHSAPDRAKEMGGFDWVFNGEAERTFPEAVARWFGGGRDLSGIQGLSWRDADGEWIDNGGEDSIDDLDALPLPAWDLVPFDLYASRINMNGPLKAERYAPLFTSRGCPYKCNYCHDVFGKSYRWRSPESVLDEMAHLVSRYGVGEFQIVDDIYNLHKPRMRRIAKGVIERFGARKLHFCFPNGLRGDILEPADLPLLAEMGVYEMYIAIETVTPRLQTLIDKHLDVDKTRRAIEAAAANGIMVRGLFMIGFPTETLEEMRASIDFAMELPLTFAAFLLVVPQKGTPIHEWAKKVDAAAVEEVSLKDYFCERPWYQLAYGVDLPRIQRRAYQRFYLSPVRLLRMLRYVPWSYFVEGGWIFFKLAFLRPQVRAAVDRFTQRHSSVRAEAARREAAERARRWAPPAARRSPTPALEAVG
jgi:radical SAM superfamily enzyme YgiQ (UPF0313 family)